MIPRFSPCILHLWVGLLCLVTTGLNAAEASQTSHGLKIGQKAPAWVLKDPLGQTHTLDQHLEKGPLALLFYRSADW